MANPIYVWDGSQWQRIGAVAGIPDQTGNSGKYLKTDGTTTSWAVADALPTQTGNSGKYLTTNGTTASWGAVSGGGGDTHPFFLMGA